MSFAQQFLPPVTRSCSFVSCTKNHHRAAPLSRHHTRLMQEPAVMFGVHGVLLRAGNPAATVSVKQEESDGDEDQKPDDKDLCLNVTINLPLSCFTDDNKDGQEEQKPDLKPLIKSEQDSKQGILAPQFPPHAASEDDSNNTITSDTKRAIPELDSDVETDTCPSDDEVVVGQRMESSDESSDSDLDGMIVKDTLKPEDVSKLLARCNSLLRARTDRPDHGFDECRHRAWPVHREQVEKRVNKMRLFAHQKLNDRMRQVLLLPDCLNSMTEAAETLGMIFWTRKKFSQCFLPHEMTNPPVIEFGRFPFRHYKLFFSVFMHILKIYSPTRFGSSHEKDILVKHFDEYTKWPAFLPKYKSGKGKRKTPAAGPAAKKTKTAKMAYGIMEKTKKKTVRKRKSEPVRPPSSSSGSDPESESEKSDESDNEDSDNDSFIVEDEPEAEEESSSEVSSDLEDESEDEERKIRKRCSKLLQQAQKAGTTKDSISWPRIFDLAYSVRQVRVFEERRTDRRLIQLLSTPKSLSSLSSAVQNVGRAFWSRSQRRSLRLPNPQTVALVSKDGKYIRDYRSKERVEMLPYADRFYQVFMQVQGKVRNLSEFSSSQLAAHVYAAFQQELQVN